MHNTNIVYTSTSNHYIETSITHKYKYTLPDTNTPTDPTYY